MRSCLGSTVSVGNDGRSSETAVIHATFVENFESVFGGFDDCPATVFRGDINFAIGVEQSGSLTTADERFLFNDQFACFGVKDPHLAAIVD